MSLRNLGWSTDLMFLRWSGEVTEKSGYTLVRTPKNPTFHWGNFLHFHAPPKPGDESLWREAFAREFPDVSHEAIGWESATPETDDLSEFVAAGMEREICSVMTATSVSSPVHFNADVTVRVLASESDWAQVLENQILCRDDEYEETGYRTYKERAMNEYRRLQELGRGAWFGAFLGEKLVADCGLFFKNNLGRFQSVGTHLNFRRRGICGTLVHTVARHGFDVWNLETLVIVAEDSEPAGRIYSSLGFQTTEKQVSLYRHDK